MRITLVIALLLFAVSPARAWNEPDSFRGLKWGTSETEAVKFLKRSAALEERPTCFPEDKGPCYVTGKVGPLSTTFGYFFGPDDRFERATFQFSPSNYDTLLGIFTDRYGPPTNISQEALRNRSGTTFTNHVARWIGNRVIVELYRFRGSLDHGDAVVALKEALDRVRKETERAIKKGKSDL